MNASRRPSDVVIWRTCDMRVIANLTTTWLAQQCCHGFRPPERMLDDSKLAFSEKRTNFFSSKCKESKRGRACTQSIQQRLAPQSNSLP